MAQVVEYQWGVDGGFLGTIEFSKEPNIRVPSSQKAVDATAIRMKLETPKRIHPQTLA
jgi:hypothetical protein